MFAVPYRLHEADSQWTIHEGDVPLLTPMGHPVATRHPRLAERMLEGVRAANDHDDPTPYSLQVWYLDFGRQLPVDHLRAWSLPASTRAGTWRPTLPRTRASRRACGGPTRAQGAEALDDQLRARVGRLSRRALLTVAVFSARFQSARLGLMTVDAGTDLERLALGTCRYVAERRVGRGLQGDPRYLGPALARREGFCRDHCLTRIAGHPEDDVALGHPRSARNCAARGLLEGVRLFASFPDE